ncbi:MAG: sigma-70 family RNA polymerase sigma factor [Tepidisphaeraceae bacterium]
MRNDQELLRQSGRGDEQAFRTLVDRHAPYLFGIAHGLTGNAADAEDIVQETFLAASQGGHRGESAVRTWLVAILVRRAAMLRRTRGRRGGKHVSLSGSTLPASSPTRESVIDVPARGASPAAGAEAKIDLATMLENLSDDHRAVIVLREIEGMSYEEMAAALGVPRGTVESRLHRAREELRRQFRGYLD